MQGKHVFLLGLVFILTLGGCTYSVKEESGDELINVSFEFLHGSAYNEEKVKKLWSIKDTDSFTLFESACSQEIVDLFATEGDFQFVQEYDFENYCIFIAYGRRVSKLECTIDEYYGKSWYRFVVTFEEEYSAEKVFFYQIDRRSYVPSDLSMECILWMEMKKYI